MGASRWWSHLKLSSRHMLTYNKYSENNNSSNNKNNKNISLVFVNRNVLSVTTVSYGAKCAHLIRVIVEGYNRLFPLFFFCYIGNSYITDGVDRNWCTHTYLCTLLYRFHSPPNLFFVCIYVHSSASLNDSLLNGFLILLPRSFVQLFYRLKRSRS